MRQFIRHPAGIPIDYEVGERQLRDRDSLRDIGHGGLCFISREAIPTGTCLHVAIPISDPAYEADGVVCWCRAAGERYEVGVEFAGADDEFRLRMVEQVCHIEAYRKRVREEEGRELSGEQAAREWIRKNAADFPD